MEKRPNEPPTPKAIAALRELEQWLECIRRNGKPALEWRHAEQRRLLFDGLDHADMPVTEAARLLLDRFEILEHARTRKATRREDHEALALLAVRGLSREERWRARLLVYDATPAIERVTMDEWEETQDGEKRWDLAVG